MRKCWFILMLAGFSCLSYSDDEAKDRAFIEGLLSADPQMQTMQMSDFVKSLPSSGAGLSKGHQDFIHQLQEQQERQYHTVAQPPTSGIQYFVSFSIPQQGLTTMLDYAARFRVPMNIRGMLNNDFRQTVNAIFELTKQKNQGGVQINPAAFRQYGITAVPALIVFCGDKVDRIVGDIRLDSLLHKVAEEGECAEVAKEALKEAF